MGEWMKEQMGEWTDGQLGRLLDVLVRKKMSLTMTLILYLSQTENDTVYIQIQYLLVNNCRKKCRWWEENS